MREWILILGIHSLVLSVFIGTSFTFVDEIVYTVVGNMHGICYAYKRPVCDIVYNADDCGN